MDKDYKTIEEVLQKSVAFLQAKGIDNAKTDTEWIISSILGIPRLQLYLNLGELIKGKELDDVRKGIVERGNRIPLQHILGSVEFAGINIICDHRALVPRSETEQLVEHIIKRVDSGFDGTIVDLGTGTGAIVFSLCKHFRFASGIGIDCCENALALARENLAQFDDKGRISLIQGNWFVDDFKEIQADIVVANPPYLSHEEWSSAQPEVKLHDPKGALISEDEGMQDLLKVCEVAHGLLQPGGSVYIEMGKGQADTLLLALRRKFHSAEIIRDLSSIRRFAYAMK